MIPPVAATHPTTAKYTTNTTGERFMRKAMVFAAGLLAGLAVHIAIAQNPGNGVVMMNHVCIAVPNIQEAVTYYTQTMGYREAFRVNDDKGQPRLVYMQISKNTFLELQPVSP